MTPSPVVIDGVLSEGALVDHDVPLGFEALAELIFETRATVVGCHDDRIAHLQFSRGWYVGAESATGPSATPLGGEL
jgi:hypothetical protein